MRDIVVQGVQTSMREKGQGDTLLFFHGVPDNGSGWDAVIEVLSGQYRCIAVDMPGIGRSVAPHDIDYSLENRGQWVNDLLEMLGINTPVTLISHDHGGPFALAFAVRHESYVKRLVIMNTVFHHDFHWHFWARIWRTPLLGEFTVWSQTLPINSWLIVAEMRRGSKGLSRDYIYQHVLPIKRQNSRHVMRLYRATDPQGFAGWDEQLLALVKRVPTLVLWGERDPYIDMRFPELLAAQGATLICYPHIGHWSMVENAAQVAADIGRFVEQHP